MTGPRVDEIITSRGTRYSRGDNVVPVPPSKELVHIASIGLTTEPFGALMKLTDGRTVYVFDVAEVWYGD